jgi:AraC-like DNA-binding protein
VTEAMARGGVDLDRLAECLPAAFDQLLRSPDTLSPDDLLRLLNECAALSGDESFGQHLADYLDLTRIGTFGYLLLNAPTIREFLELAVRYYPLIYRGARAALSTSGTLARFEYRMVQPCRLDPRHANEWVIAYFAKFIGAKLDPMWRPKRVIFSHRCPADLTELRRALGDNLAFEQAISGFEFESALLDTPISEANPILLRIISHHADDLIQELGRKHPFNAQVRLLIMEGLQNGQAKADVVAGKLNMSLSSFKRRMQCERLNFRELREEIVKDLAQRALAETKLPLKDIALKMGYSELSAFDRAFVRLTGMTPLAFRRSAANSEGPPGLSRQQ